MIAISKTNHTRPKTINVPLPMNQTMYNLEGIGAAKTQ